MADILTGDVQTYVRELIAKEFGSVDKGKEAFKASPSGGSSMVSS